jgi:CspA family cold shock protein
MPIGVVKWFNDKKGYGFIRCDSIDNDIFVHYSAINQNGFKTLLQGQQVQFDLDSNPKGARASNVSVVQA